MTELFDMLRGHGNDNARMSELGGHAQLATLDEAQASFHLALQAVEAVAAECAQSFERIDELLAASGRLKWADRNDPSRLYSGSEELIGEQTAEILFGESLSMVEGYVAAEADISTDAAADVVRVVSAVFLATAAGLPDEETDLAVRLGADPQALAEARAAKATGAEAGAASAAEGESEAESAKQSDQGSSGQATQEPTDAGTATDAATAEAGLTAAMTASDEHATTAPSAEPGAAPSAAVPVAAAEPSPDDPEAGSPAVELRERQKRIAIGTAAAVVVAGMFFGISNGGDSEPTETLAATESIAEQADTDEAGADGGSGDVAEPSDTGSGQTTDDGDDTDGTDDSGDDATAGEEDDQSDDTAAESPIVTYNVPMVDIADPDRDAEGILGFDFNTETGEVCYRVLSTNIDGPYRTHIHVGASGEKGGIVVDMGPQVSGAVGCLDNPPADINNILADLDNHYAELHDVSEEWTIRGQLSEAIEQSGASLADLTFDPSSDGAYLAIENGIAVLRGEVPNLLTATSLSAHYAPGGSGLVVTSELTVDPTAAAPSGRIVLADHEFPVNSDEVPTIDEATEATLTAILDAQDGWKLTAVGRTDSDGSELNNLELSLRRAKALRTYVEGLDVHDGAVLVRGAGDLGVQGRLLELEFVPGD
ncbi:MAG: CHRD domain-containing protein [Actinomycetota bacterium]